MSLKARTPWLFAIAATVSAAAHIPVIAPHLEEAPYMGVLFILLTTACFGFAITSLVTDPPILYSTAAAVCGTAILGYAATRLVAFPQLADDVGNWFEPLGVVSIIAESVVVATAVLALRSRRSAPRHAEAAMTIPGYRHH